MDAISKLKPRSRQSKFQLEPIEPRMLLSTTPIAVEQFFADSSGCTIQFNQAVDATTLSLYDTEAGTPGPADITVVGDTQGAVRGSLVVRGNQLTFIKTGGPLASDVYTVTMRSAANGIKGSDGSLLDGNGDGTSGDNYTHAFTISPVTGPTVGIADFARGPGQVIQVPAPGSGIPISISDGSGVTSVDLELHYDPSLLKIVGIVPGAALPAGSTVLPDLTVEGTLTLHISSPTALPSGPIELVRLPGEVPHTAPYGATALLDIANLSINNGGITATADDGIEGVVYFGDTTGNRSYSALDGSRVLRVVVGLDNGFAAFPIIDPVLISDITGNGILSALDGTRILQEIVGLDRTEIQAVTPVIHAQLLHDTGVRSADGVTLDPTITGTVRDDGTIASFKARIDIGTSIDVTADLINGGFSFSRERLEEILGGPLTDGTHTLSLQAIDNGGNASTVSSFSFTFDSTAPTIADFNLSAGSDTGIAGDSITAAAAVVLTGSVDPGSMLALGGTPVLSTGAGTFQIPNVALNPGTNSLMVVASDVAGNTSQANLVITREGVITADVALQWNQQALDAIRLAVTVPTIATRVLAMVALAQYDTLAAIENTPAYLVQQAVTGPVSVDAALAKAAHTVLYALFPSRRAVFDTALNSLLQTVADGSAKANALALGVSVGNGILAIRSQDGSDAFVDYPGSEEVGLWRPTAPMFEVAEEPQWGDVTPFALNSPDEFRALAPPALDSAAYTQSVEEIRSLGSATSATRTADQTQTAQFWADGKGSYTPPGHWNQIAQQIALAEGNSLSSNVRLLAQLNIALADAAIAVWDSKYTYDLWRPIDAIHDAELDGNAATIEDDSWTPLLITPFHPEYVSGHSTFSSAAAGVLGAAFGDNTAFSTTAFTLPGVTRSFTSFTQAAQEAGRSRIYGGIHYEFTNQAGQVMGQQVAAAVLERFALNQDVQPPVVIADPTPAVTNANLALTGQILDNISGVGPTQYRFDSGALQQLVLDGEGKFSITTAFALNGTADAEHTITILTRDAAGNVASDFVRGFTLDTRSPSISLGSIAEGGIIDVLPRLTGVADPTGSSLVQLDYKFDGGTARSISFDNESGAFDVPMILGNLSVGSHALTITARDAGGNQATLIRNVTLDQALPFFISSVTPQQGASEVGSTFRPVIQFSRSVDLTTLASDSLYATGPDGQVIPATIVPAADGSFAWLFFESPLPGASVITLHIDGSLIQSAAGHQLLDADGNGQPGGALATSFLTVSTTSVAGTKLIGKVVDPGPDLEPMTFDDIRRGPDGVIHTADDVFLLPIVHAKVFILGQESSFVFTDANGNFVLDGVPVGNVKVAIDGRTATNAPAGSFFPEMVMDANLIPGITNTLMGSMGTLEEQLENASRSEVYLPRIPSNILQTVGNSQSTQITVDANASPDLSDEERQFLTLTVAPGSAIGEDGQPLTNVQIGISTVPPELVRDMLPPGVLQHTFDITIQAPGVAAFAEPLQITFPNVFNELPGTKVNILSFDHTTGRLVINGTGTVSADGKFVVSDPDSGIKAPGWHGLALRSVRLASGAYAPPFAFLNGSPDPDPQIEDLPPETGNNLNDPLFSNQYQAPSRIQDGRPEWLQPFRLINVSVDGAVDKYLEAEPGSVLPVTGGSFVIRAGEPGVFRFGVQNLALGSVVGPWGAGMENFRTSVLFANHYKITNTVVDPLAATPAPAEVKEYFVDRFIDASDDVSDGAIKFETTLNDGIGGVQRSKSIQIISGAESSITVLTSSNAGGFSVSGSSGEIGITFDPTSSAGPIGGVVSYVSAAPLASPKTIGLSGFGADRQRIVIDTTTFQAELALLAGSGTISWETVALLGNPNLLQLVRTRVQALFPLGTQVVLQANASLAPNTITVLAQQFPGGKAGEAFEDMTLLNYSADLKFKSPGQQQYIVDKAINSNTSAEAKHDPFKIARIADESARLNHFTLTIDDLVAVLASNIAHEAGHSLGLPHTSNSSGVSVPDGTDDVMAQGLDFGLITFGHRSFTSLTSGLLRMALNLVISSEEFQTDALPFLLNAKSKGLPASHAGIAKNSIGDSEQLVTETGEPPTAVLFHADNGGIVRAFLEMDGVLADGISGAKRTAQLELANLGSSPLVISGITIHGGSEVLQLSGISEGLILAQGQSKSFVIEYDPLVVEDRTASVRIESNDPSGPIEFVVRAQSVSAAPYAWLAAEENNAGGVLVGAAKTESSAYLLTNRGQSPLILSDIHQLEGAGLFSIVGLSDLSSNPLTIDPGATVEIGFQFTPASPGLLRGVFELETNDPIHPLLRVVVSGTGFTADVVPDWGRDFIALDTSWSPAGTVLRTVSDRGGKFELVAAPATPYSLFIFDPATGLIATGIGSTPAAGQDLDITRHLAFRASATVDSDFDGVPDDIELAVGTARHDTDSDNDGIDDFVEITNGTNPLDGRSAVTGIIASLALSGEAKGVVLEGSTSGTQTAFIATGTYGLAIVNASDFSAPVVLGQLDLPGDSVDVSVDSFLGIAAVASGAGGLNFINVSVPGAPSLLRSIAFNATQVEVFEGIAYASSGTELRAYDLLTGEKFASSGSAANIVGIAREGRTLFTLNALRNLQSFSIVGKTLLGRGSLLLTVAGNKLFVGGGIAYVSTAGGSVQGFSTVNVSNPDVLTLISGVDAPTIIGQSLAANGSGLLITAGSIITATSLAHAVDVVNVSDPANTGSFITRFMMPQIPFDIAIGGGIAFVADGVGDLQIVNYRSFDSLGVPPTVTAGLNAIDLDPVAPGIQLLEGSALSLMPAVSDDVQVRNVELMLNGVVVRSDVAFPFELNTTLPSIAANGSDSVVLQVRATDTGGNIGLSVPVSVQLVPDTFGPVLLASNIVENGVVGPSFRTVLLTFSEAIDPSAFGLTAVQTISSGGTALSPQNIQFHNGGTQVQLTLAQHAVGAYTLRIDRAQVKDNIGNTMGAGFLDTHFEIVPFTVEWISGSGGNWNTAANWSTGVVPVATDDVFIGVTSSPVIISSGSVTITSLVSKGSVALSGGTLTLIGNSQMDAPFTLSGGTLTGTGVLTLTGAGHQWTGGTITGVGTTRVTGNLAITGNGQKSLSGGRILSLEGTATWGGNTAINTNLITFNNGTINNSGTWNDANGFATVLDLFSGTNAFNNTGTYNKQVNTTTTVEFAFNNTASVNVNSGMLSLAGGGTDTGTFNIAAGTTLDFSFGTHHLNNITTAGLGTMQISGNGSFTFVNINGGTFPTAVVIVAGNVQGTGAAFTGDVNWTGGTMIGAGTFTFNTLAITGNNTKSLTGGRILNLTGTTTWSGNTGANGNLISFNGGTINNSGTWNDANAFGSSLHLFSGTNAFNNSGIYDKQLDTITTVVIQFNNTATANVNAGRLVLTGGGTDTGTFNVAAGSVLDFNGGIHNLNNVTTAGAGTLEISGSLSFNFVNVNGGIFPTTIVISGGNLQGAGATFTGGATWTGGIITGAGAFTFNSTFAITGNTSKSISGNRILNLAGTTTWSGNTLLNNNAIFFGGGTINNSGTWNDSNSLNSSFSLSNGTNAFNNTGVYNKLGSTVTTVGIAFNNAATTNVNAGTLTLTGGGTDTGTFNIANGALLDFNAGTHNLNNITTSGAGTLQISGSTFNTMNVNGGTYPTTVLINGGILQGTGATFAGPATWSNGTITGAGSFTFSNTLAITGGAVKTLSGNRVLNLEGTTTWSGSGQILFGGGTINNSGTWNDTNASNASLGTAGVTNLFNNIGIYNKQGSAVTTIAGPFANNGTMNLNAGTVGFGNGGTHSGTFTIAAGAILDLSAGTHNLNNVTTEGSGILQITGSTSFNFVNFNGGTHPISVVLSGGSMQGSGAAFTGTVTWTSGAMAGAGSFDFTNTLVISGALKNLSGNRILNLSGTTNWTGNVGLNGNQISFSGGTINNSGTWNDSNAFATVLDAVNGINAFNNTGVYNKQGSATTTVEIPFNNSSTGSVNVTAGTLSLAGGGTQGGTFNIAAGSILNLSGVHIMNNIATAGAGTLQLSSGLQGTSTTFNVAVNWTAGTMTGAGSFTFSNLAITGASNKVLSGGRILNLTGTTTWSGNTGANNSIALSGGATINNSGTWTDLNTFATSITHSTGAIAVNNSGTYSKQGNTATTIQGPFSNSGTLEVLAGTMSFTGTFVQTAGITRLGGGNLAGGIAFNFQGGILAGSGSITGNVTNAATIEVGGAGTAGTLNITGNYTQTSPGVLRMEIGGLTAGTQFDRFLISGSATLAGTLDLLLINAYVPALSDSFQMLTFASRVNQFATVSGTNIGGGRTLNISYNPTNVTVTVV